jgi:hypothetical protein
MCAIDVRAHIFFDMRASDIYHLSCHIKMEGFERLKACDSFMLQDAKKIGSCIGQIGCDHCAEVHAESKLQSIIMYIHHSYEHAYSDLFLDSSYDLDVIESVSLVFNDGWMTIHEISGDALRIRRKLSGQQAVYGLIQLPFNKLDMLDISSNSIAIIVRLKFPRQMIMSNIRDSLGESAPSIPSALTDIIGSYVSIDAQMSLWGRCITYENDVVETKLRNSNPFLIPILQTQEEIVYFMPMQAWITISSQFLFLMNKITMIFSRADDPYETALDVMESGTLTQSGHVAFRWTGRSAHIFDKVEHGRHVPDEPIYTITFEKNELNLGTDIPHSRVNFSSDVSLSFRVKPQPFEMKLRIIGENLNMMAICQGMACVRYTK